MEHETSTVFMLTHGPGDRESLAETLCASSFLQCDARHRGRRPSRHIAHVFDLPYNRARAAESFAQVLQLLRFLTACR